MDNTPDPEPEDVQAHLIGGIPEKEVDARQTNFARFGVATTVFFTPERPGYLAFLSNIDSKSAIKTRLEADPQLQQTLACHHDALEAWWQGARDDFALLREGKKLPEVRSELLTTLKGKLVPLEVLDEFKSAGLFVNWWQTIRYDLKTVISTGWHHTLIPDDYLIAEYFQAEADEIEALEAQIGEAQSELSETVETVAEAASYEPDDAEEGEDKLTATGIKKYLKELIDDLAGTAGESARKERQKYEELRDGIAVIEKRIKAAKESLKEKQNELELKLTLKRIGGDEAKAEARELIGQVTALLAGLSPQVKEEKKKITTLTKDKTALELRLSRIDGVLAAIGGQMSEEDAKGMILKKLYNLANQELQRYLNAEKRALVGIIENLWDKYAVSSRVIEAEREKTLSALNEFLAGLGYLG